jgi:hypothetical protein
MASVTASSVEEEEETEQIEEYREGFVKREEDEREKNGNLEPKREALERRERWVVVLEELRKEESESKTLPHLNAFAILVIDQLLIVIREIRRISFLKTVKK